MLCALPCCTSASDGLLGSMMSSPVWTNWRLTQKAVHTYVKRRSSSSRQSLSFSQLDPKVESTGGNLRNETGLDSSESEWGSFSWLGWQLRTPTKTPSQFETQRSIRSDRYKPAATKALVNAFSPHEGKKFANVAVVEKCSRFFFSADYKVVLDSYLVVSAIHLKPHYIFYFACLALASLSGMPPR